MLLPFMAFAQKASPPADLLPDASSAGNAESVRKAVSPLSPAPSTAVPLAPDQPSTLTGSPSADMPTGDNPEMKIPTQPTDDATRRTADGAQAATFTQARLSSLIDRDVSAVAGGNLGHIVDVLIGANGEIRAVVIDIGGFLGVGNRRVAVASSLLRVNLAAPQSPVIALVPANAVRSAPAYNPENSDVSVLTGPFTPVAPEHPVPASDHGAASPPPAPSPGQ
ncbi:hypothetical protein GOB81_02305 [Acetobacter sp. LMG 1627]|uniref:PRC-barrel domain-containing protein n=2 Tax=Acetobacter conturbans TaxID=1737472 RepID=A0ABX0JVD3_9PROT|nr:hypothetical protein [Acetobacter conturbans]